MSDFLTDENFSKFRNVIYNESGIHFSTANRSILESRLKERLKISKLDSIEEYHRLILSSPEELKVLLDSVTTNLTRFFRNTAHVETFDNYVIPELIRIKREKGDKSVRVWSAGCSTGEEPYTIAMSLKEKLPADFQVIVTASDLSLKSLMVGTEGFYPESRISGVPEQYLKKYFEQRGSGYQVREEIRKLIKFDYHNLKNDSGQRNLDVIFCRNVLIYFDEPAQKNVVDRFWDALAPYSFLFIGHSESLFGMNTRFEFLKTDWACIYRKKT